MINVCLASLKSTLKNNPWNFIHQMRRKSAWIKESDSHGKTSLPSTSNNSLNPEDLFVRREVQDLLRKIMSVDINKVYAFRLKKDKVGKQEQKMHYALMTEDKLEQVKLKYAKMADYFLQLVPIKEPLPETYTVISEDVEIKGHDEATYCFYDIGPDAWGDDRLCVYRDQNGTLRTAKPEELRRMNRAFYPQPDRPVIPPAVFSDPHLAYALEIGKHELVLDFACWFFEPNELRFVQLVQDIIDRTVQHEKLELLYGTRHFSTATFYLLLNKKVEPLLKFFTLKNDIRSMGNIIRLYKIMHSDWRISNEDDDFKILFEFAKREQLTDPELTRYLNLDLLKSSDDLRART